MRIIQLFMLVLILVTMEACAFRSQPPYQPLPHSISNWGVNRQGYFDFQIDDHTYFIGYFHYQPFHVYLGLGSDWSDRAEDWLKGAQEYVLYRASELTKSKGQRSFMVLFKDDWLYTGYFRSNSLGKYHMPSRFKRSPGAWVIIRFIDENTMPLQGNDDRVYLADTLLEIMAQENDGLSESQRTGVQPRRNDQYVPRSFQRWRSSSSAYDSVPVPGAPDKRLFQDKYIEFEWGSKETQTAPGTFAVAIWQDALISPMHMLWQCMWLADREGYKVFTLKNWTVEEHIGRTFTHYVGKVWFRSTVDVVLQQEKGPARFEPVFVVDEIRSHFGTSGVPYPDF